jgi:hypothetical protein
MTTAAPHMVIGRVGFASNGEFVAHPADASELIAELEAEIAKLTRHRNRLRRALQNCAALSPAASDEKHEALLETDPKNYEKQRKNP